MSGIYALLLIALWTSGLSWLCWRLVRRRFRPPINRLIAYILVLILFPLPVIDEIVGAVQMNRLCEKNATYRLGVPDPEGRVTRYRSDPQDERMSGTAVPIFHTRVYYVDTATGETVVTYDRYKAGAGVLGRTFFSWSATGNPFIGRSYCSPDQQLGQSPRLTFKFSVVN